jgi:polyferredoxin
MDHSAPTAADAPRAQPRPIIPIASAPPRPLQRRRRGFQAAFFALFLLAPVFNLFRYDLAAGHAWLLGMPWRLGLDDFLAGRIGPLEASANVMLRLFVPLLGGAALFLWSAWKWGRLYCGWLCPHFSVVELINGLMLRASGKPSIWEKQALTPWRADGTQRRIDPRWWFLVLPAAVGFAFLWAVIFLTYLQLPADVYRRLFTGTLSRGQMIFLTAATIAITIEFLFARHLFCRFACAVGLFQSLVWMTNHKAMVVGFSRARAADCANCLPEKQSACDAVCPMRLTPRNIKRHMFTCTQCVQCIDACGETQAKNPNGPLLSWVEGEAAQRNEAGFRAGREI